MKYNILITGTSKGIGNYLLKNLEKDNNIFDISGKNEIDLRKKEDIEKFCNKIKEKKVYLDILILNAGIGEFGSFESNNLEDYESIINLNLLSNIRILKLLENNIKGINGNNEIGSINKNTKIIFIGSIISKKFMKNASVYQASKFGLRGLAGGLKNEGKKVFLINPKIVKTDFHKGKVGLNNNLPITELKDILNIINLIIDGKEKRFEIDL